MKMRKLISLAMAGVMCLSLAACGGSTGNGGNAGNAGGSGSGTAEAPAKSGNGETLVVNIWDNNQVEGLRQIANEWSEKSGVDVRIDVIAWDSYWTLLEAGASGGELPDVFWMHINEADKYMGAGILMDLDDYIAADDNIDLSNYYEGIVELYNHDGSQYALPKDHDTIALLYNKTIFDKYGIDYPTNDWDWDDYAATAKAITEAAAAAGDEVYGTAMNTNDGQDGWYNLIYDFGGKLISDDKKTSGMDDPNTIAAMTWLADNLFPYMPSQSLMAETDPDVLFQSGMVGMMLQGSWMVKTFYDYQQESGDEYAWAEIPYYDANGNGSCEKEERVSMYNGLGWAVDVNTENPQAAYDLISAFASEEGQRKQSELGVTMAAYKGASDDFITAFEGMDLTPFLSIEDDGTIIQHPYSHYTTRWESAFTDGLVAAWQNPDSMEQVCRDLAAAMNNILADEQ